MYLHSTLSIPYNYLTFSGLSKTRLSIASKSATFLFLAKNLNVQNILLRKRERMGGLVGFLVRWYGISQAALGHLFILNTASYFQVFMNLIKRERSPSISEMNPSCIFPKFLCIFHIFDYFLFWGKFKMPSF